MAPWKLPAPLGQRSGKALQGAKLVPLLTLQGAAAAGGSGGPPSGRAFSQSSLTLAPQCLCVQTHGILLPEANNKMAHRRHGMGRGLPVEQYLWSFLFARG